MKFYKNSNILEFQPKILNKETLEMLHVPSTLPKYITNQFVEIDGKFYYYKNVDQDELISELIGSYLCKVIGLDAVDYQIGTYKNLIYALSEIFYEDDYIYSNCKEYYGFCQNTIKKIPAHIYPYYKRTSMLKLIDNPIMLSNILKLTALDVRSGQLDRNNSNIILKTSIKTGITDLEKIYDFSYSFLDKSIYTNYFEAHRFYSDNPFLILRRNEFSINAFCKQYPEIITYFKALNDISIEEILLQIERDKRIVLTKESIERFKRSDDYLRRCLTKI